MIAVICMLAPMALIMFARNRLMKKLLAVPTSPTQLVGGYAFLTIAVNLVMKFVLTVRFGHVYHLEDVIAALGSTRTFPVKYAGLSLFIGIIVIAAEMCFRTKRVRYAVMVLAGFSLLLYLQFFSLNGEASPGNIVCIILSVIVPAVLIYLVKSRLRHSVKQAVLLSLVIAFFIEFFVCNYRHFDCGLIKNSVICDDEFEISSENAEMKGYWIVECESAPTVIIHTNAEIKSLYIDVNTASIAEITVGVDDEATEGYRYFNKLYIVDSVESSHYIRLNTYGVTDSVSITFNNLTDNFTIEGISFNAIRPMDFRLTRYLIIFFVVLLIFALNPKYPFIRIVYCRKRWQLVILMIAIALNAAFCFWTAKTSSGTYGEAFNESMYNEAAESLAEGHLYLNEEPPAVLSDMENPYDRVERDRIAEENGVSVKWDSAYYNGKYYMYFGAVPLFLLYYPLELLGVKLFSWVCVFIFSVILILAAVVLLEGINRKWFRGKIPFVIYLMGLLLYINSSGILYFLRRPNFYEAASSSSIAFLTLGIGLWLNSFGENGKLRKGCLFFGSLSMALVAGCRPHCVLYSAIYIPLFYAYTFRPLLCYRQSSRAEKTEALKNFIITALPYIAVAIPLMLYNYMRFDSPFNFGNTYQLTVADMRTVISLNKIPLGIWMMYLQPFHISNAFPFVEKISYEVSYQGYYYISSTTGGLLFANMICLFIFGLFGKKTDKSIKSFVGVSVALGIFISFVIVVTSGLHMRYNCDFAWIFTLCGFVSMLAMALQQDNKEVSDILYKIFGVFFFADMAFHICLSFAGESDTLLHNSPEAYYLLRDFVCFWL